MKKLLAILLSLALMALPLLAVGEALAKDETVYALLGAGGDARQVLVVSHIDTPADGTYTDYGDYAAVHAMLDDVQPVVDGDAIEWTLPQGAEGFFAVGELEGVALPFDIAIEYRLEGAVIVPDALPGLGGHIDMTITVAPNPAADRAYTDRFMAQVQVPLPLTMASNIDAPGASATLVGQTWTLAYIVLPGQTASYTVSFDTERFEMDSITIASATIDIEGMLGLDIGDLTGQATSLTDGARALADGGTALAGGLGTLAAGTQTLADEAAALPAGIAAATEGIGQLSEAIGALPAQMTALTDGSQQLAEGVSGYVDGAGQALGAIGALSDGLGTLSDSGAQLATNVGQLETGLAPILMMLPEAQATALKTQLAALTEGTTAYTQGVTAAAGQVAALSEGVAPLLDGGTALKAGMAQQNAGIGALAAGLGEMATQAAALPEGMSQLQTGAQQLSDAIGEVNTAVRALPEQASQLAQGQTALADGLDEAISALTDMPIATAAAAALPSFASPQHTVRSVQFVYRTDAIAVPAEARAVAVEEAPQTFWERLVALF